jgi:peptide/nickel transport system ATP-binding protein
MYPSQLSGGQLQRLALAKLLLLNPSLLILDEPFASQDVVSINNLIKIFIQINHQLKTTFLVISHEIPYLLKFCDRIGVMKDGELKDILIIKKTDRKVEIQNITSDYTKFLLQTFEINL